MNWSLIVAANDDTILKRCLTSSPCIGHACDVNVMRGFATAGAAYNAGMHQAAGEILVFAHQDVYLPAGWDRNLGEFIDKLSGLDPDWAVLGVFGITPRLQPHGYLYCTGSQKVLGAPFSEPVNCVSLDEVVLVLRRASGLHFDERLPGFHLYGTDLCLEAKRHGWRSYIISAFCIHNTEITRGVLWAFWRSYFYMRRKWRDCLPVRTPCTELTYWAWPVATSIARELYTHYFKGERPSRRVSDPAELLIRLLKEHTIILQSTTETTGTCGGRDSVRHSLTSPHRRRQGLDL
jgi:hypothetical protein